MQCLRVLLLQSSLLFWYIPNNHRILDLSLTYNLLVDEYKFLYNRKFFFAIQKLLQLFKQLFKFRYLNRYLYLWGQGIRKNSLTKLLYRKLMFNTFLSKCLWGELVINTQILKTSGYHFYKHIIFMQNIPPLNNRILA